MAKYLGIPLTVSNGNKVPLTAQPELISNNDFSVSGNLTTSSWELGWESSDTDGSNISGGIFSLINDDDSDFDGRAWATNGVDARLALEQNQAYELTYTIAENLNNASLNIYYGNFSGAQPNTVGTHTVKFTQNGSASNMFVLRNATNNTTIKFSSIFLKEIAATETPTYGSPELLENGDFSHPTDGWTFGANTSIVGGKLVCTNSTAYSATYQPVTIFQKAYVVTFTIDSISGGSVTPSFQNSISLTPRSVAGTYTEKVVAPSSSTRFEFYSDTAGVSFEISSVSLKEVPYVMGTRELLKDGSFPPNTTAWTFGGGATLEANGAKISNESSGGVDIANIQQILPFSVSELTGRTFELTYDVVATNGEVLAIQQSNNILLDTTTVGVNRKVIFNWDFGFNDVRIKRHASGLITDVTIDNLFLKELEYNYLQVADGGFKKSVKEGDVVFNTSTGTEGVVKEVIDNNVLLISNDNFSTADEFFNVFAANGDTRGNQLIKTDNYIMSEYDENTSNPQESSFWFAGGKNSDKVVLTQLNPATNTFFVAGVIEEYLERLNSQSATDSRLDIPLDAFRDHQYNETLTTTAITLS